MFFYISASEIAQWRQQVDVILLNKIILKLKLSKNVVLDWYSYKGQLISKADWGPIVLISLKIEFFDDSKYNFKILLDKFQVLWIWDKSAKCEYCQSDYK